MALGEDGEARPLGRRLLETRRKQATAADAAAGSKHAYARYALTCEPADQRDPEDALIFALEACEMTERRNADFLDTLALAYRRTGRLRQAVETQREALAALPAQRSETRRSFEERLDDYEKALGESLSSR